MPGKTKRWIAACGLLALLGGCSSANKPTNENFTQALNDYYDAHNSCLFPHGQQFPFEVAPGPTAKELKQQMDSLTDAGLATRLEDRSIHVFRYSLNAAGNRAAPRFCYGHRSVSGIESFTLPAPHNGFTETTVTYHYVMKDVPVWARTDQVKAAFPQLAKDLSDSPTDQATLATVGAGWHVPQ